MEAELWANAKVFLEGLEKEKNGDTAPTKVTTAAEDADMAG